jgi:hypothetical protein
MLRYSTSLCHQQCLERWVFLAHFSKLSHSEPAISLTDETVQLVSAKFAFTPVSVLLSAKSAEQGFIIHETLLLRLN